MLLIEVHCQINFFSADYVLDPYQNTLSCSNYDLASIWLEGYIINAENK